MPRLPFPSQEDLREVVSFLFAMDGGGKHIVDQEIINVVERKNACKILEVGLFVGHSAKRWLDVSPQCHLIGVDLFERNESVFDNYFERQIEWATKQFAGVDKSRFVESYKRHGQASTFFKNLEEYSSRVTIYKGNFFGEVNVILRDHPDVDVIFLDADKGRGLLDQCHRHFPDAVLTGDDWTWGEHLGFPMQAAVKEFCSDHGFSHVSAGATWKILK